ncbi:hypothetical protein [Corynebacterium sp. TAE3-ERU2]|uniref:hypothetical protein n=1 Tax=Corynebacterium sp. TAE3-ERU2 TaxID=2849497 RepID=UPI001C467A6D|nr:hypothetical protein [Corynebacterium sp. TAE3-ERU2]MBV7301935.1 hypothetical protein [Corynebacterium sp. TAE3-ERU2]
MSSTSHGSRPASWLPTLVLAPAFFLVGALFLLPSVGPARSSEPLHYATEPTAPAAPTAPIYRYPVEPAPLPLDNDVFGTHAAGSQVSFVRLSDGEHHGTANERFARPALSLIKLYIADYVLDHGSATERKQALTMVRDSSDSIAAALYESYPEAIDTTATRYDLQSTRANSKWGYSVTSTYDVCFFLAQKLEEDPNSPLLRAMRTAKPVAADGYKQNFGTSTLPGAEGSKWGWSNSRTLHSSVSFGEDYVAAAAIAGSAEDLTDLVEQQLAGLVPEQSADT